MFPTALRLMLAQVTASVLPVLLFLVRAGVDRYL